MDLEAKEPHERMGEHGHHHSLPRHLWSEAVWSYHPQLSLHELVCGTWLPGNRQSTLSGVRQWEELKKGHYHRKSKIKF